MSLCEQPTVYCRKALLKLIFVGMAAIWFAACGNTDSMTETVECNIGETREVRCGTNDIGLREDVCVDYRWTHGKCVGDTECNPGTSRGERCGLNGRGQAMQRCSTDGYWVFEDETRLQGCEDDGVDDLLDCMCDDIDACTDGDTIDEIACGELSQGLKPGICEEGNWVGQEDAPCIGENRCDPDDVEEHSCGINDRGVQYRLCEDEIWAEQLTECEDPDVCEDDEVEERLCDYGNGDMLQERVCIDGQWGEFGECTDRGGCEGNGSQLVVCGEDNSGRKTRVCSQGQWSYDAPCEQAAQRLYSGPYAMFIGLDTPTEIRAFGHNDNYQLGIDSDPQSDVFWPTPSDALLPSTGQATHFDSSVTHSCAIVDDGDVYCWGDNAEGQLGISRGTSHSETPVAVPLNAPATTIATGEAFTCALTEAQDVFCWGANDRRQLGVESSGTHIPQKTFSNASFLSVGAAHACAVKDEDPTYEVYCWGDNTKSQAADSSAPIIETPTVFETLSQNPKEDDEPTGGNKKCDQTPEWNQVLGLTLAGNTSYVIRYVRWRYKVGAMCRKAWAAPFLAYDRTLLGVGENDKGQLGSGSNVLSTAKILDFAREEDSDGRALRNHYALHASASAVCTEDTSGDEKHIRCMGDNTHKQLSDGLSDRLNSLTSIHSAFDPGHRKIRHFALGVDSACALLEDTKRIRCRGSNAHGQRGDGSGPLGDSNLVRHIMDAD